MKTTHLTILTMLAAGIVAGCQDQKCTGPADDFFAVEGNSRTQTVLDAQAASGARADGMLYAAHFTGPALNSLGAAKLDRMLGDDDPCQPLTVYLNLPEKDTQAAARKSATVAYLRDRGLTNDQVRIVAGENLDTLHPAAPMLKRMDKTESSAASPDGMSAPTQAPTDETAQLVK